MALIQLNDKIAEFEQEKFEMQKQHTQNIQELLDETNQRLQKMETEYNQQNAATVSETCKCTKHICKINIKTHGSQEDKVWGGSMTEWLERWCCNPEAPSSSPPLTANRINS